MAMKERIVIGLARVNMKVPTRSPASPAADFRGPAAMVAGLERMIRSPKQAEEHPADDGDGAPVVEEEILHQGQAEGGDKAVEGVGQRRPQPRGQARDPAAGERPLDAEQPDRPHRCRDRDADDEALDE